MGCRGQVIDFKKITWSRYILTFRVPRIGLNQSYCLAQFHGVKDLEKSLRGCTAWTSENPLAHGSVASPCMHERIGGRTLTA